MADRVTVVPYDPAWPGRFDEERRALAAVFAGTEAVIEHVGSTAVPGLGAKPVIDIMVGVPVLVAVEGRIPALEAAGYEYRPGIRKATGRPTVLQEAAPWAARSSCALCGHRKRLLDAHLAFRDYLRAHPESAAAYYNLKQELAMHVSKGEYTEAKSSFVEGVLASAMHVSHTAIYGNPTTWPSTICSPP